MNEEQLKTQIKEELDKVETEIHKKDHSNPRQKQFEIDYIRRVVNGLLELAQFIRYNHILTKEGSPRATRVIYDLIQNGLAQGQVYTRLLFYANLRDSISDKIEHFYGISFSGLRVYPEVKSKDGIKAYVAYYMPEYCRDVTLFIDGDYKFLTTKEYHAEFSAAEKS